MAAVSVGGSKSVEANSEPPPTIVDSNTDGLGRNLSDDKAVDAQGHSNVSKSSVSVDVVAGHGLSTDGNQGADNNAGVGKSVLHKQNSRVPYASLFKANRLAKECYKLEFFANGSGKLNFGYEHIDYVEKTYGICLLGFVLSGKLPSAALHDLVRRWGTNIQFQTHENGWITFTFPSVEVKEKVPRGGNYKVFGHHLFLKEMPRCFRFRDEDLTSFPAWVQVHGLPPDRWTSHKLSNIVSRIGQPVHVDMITFNRKKKSKYARVLVDVNTSTPCIDGIQ